MSDEDFDAACIAACFEAIAAEGWQSFSLPAAIRQAGLDLPRARGRFPSRAALLLRFGTAADRAALSAASGEGSTSEILFDMLMCRLDVLQTHRAGVTTLLRAAPLDPPTTLLLATASLASMRWILEAAGVPAAGPLGLIKAKGLLAVWLWTVRAWMRDESPDLSATMAALNDALARAGSIARSLPCGTARADEPPESPPAEPPPATEASPS